MKIPSEKQALLQVVKRLRELLRVGPHEIRSVSDHRAADADGMFQICSITFVIEWKSSGDAASVNRAIEQIHHYSENLNGNILPLVAVPFMDDVGRKLCTAANVAWLDLSGNAQIFAPGLHILIEGKPNQYKRRGRPSTAFAPKASRIARWLLMHPGESRTQREIARSIGLDEGYTSKVVRRLEDDGLIVRKKIGAVAPVDPDLLLDAWLEDYDFTKHDIIRGHVAARSGDSLLGQLADTFHRAAVPYAATGLAAAWLYTSFAGFRTVTIYLPQYPTPDMLSGLSFRQDVRGANVWLVLPNDEGVFHGKTMHEGIPCVHPVQAYLDLQSHPERAQEAAQKLRAELLDWRDNDRQTD